MVIARRNAARIGIDLGGTKIQGVVLEPDGRESAALRPPTPVQGYDATLDSVVALAEALDDRRRLSVGIGTPGSRLPRSGLMQNCNSTWLNGRPLLTDLENRLGPRVRIANDADCFALSEASEGGSADRYPVVFGIILGTGVGGGIVIDGRPLAGLPVQLRSELSPLGIWRTTDAEGRLETVLPVAGRWILRGTDVRPAADGSDRWGSRFLTLAFEVQPKR